MSGVEGTSVALCAEDLRDMAHVARLLKELGCVVHTAESPEQFDRLLEREPVNIVLAHVCRSGPSFLAILRRPGLPPVVPLLTDKELYLETITCGAFDCLPLSAQRDELERIVHLAIHRDQEQEAFAAGA